MSKLKYIKPQVKKIEFDKDYVLAFSCPGGSGGVCS